MKLKEGMIVAFIANESNTATYRGIGQLMEQINNEEWEVRVIGRVPYGYASSDNANYAVIYESEMRRAAKAQQTLFMLGITEAEEETS